MVERLYASAAGMSDKKDPGSVLDAVLVKWKNGRQEERTAENCELIEQINGVSEGDREAVMKIVSCLCTSGRWFRLVQCLHLLVSVARPVLGLEVVQGRVCFGVTDFGVQWGWRKDIRGTSTRKRSSLGTMIDGLRRKEAESVLDVGKSLVWGRTKYVQSMYL